MPKRRVLAGLLALLAGTPLGAPLAPAAAEELSKPRIPNFFDPNYRLPKPELGQVKSIRFLTTDDFPPFHFALPDGSLAGLDIDLARAICDDLQIACTIQARRFDKLIPQIKEDRDDALIAAVVNSPATRAGLDFTAPYYKTPARFVTAAASKLQRVTPEALAGRTIGVEAGTAHEAYLRAFFPKIILKTLPNQPSLRAALQKSDVEAIFGDGIALALWLNGAESKSCCAFRGGPYTESHFFGNGVSIAVAKGNVTLRQTLDYELARIAKNGTFADLYLKYFPIGFY
jgi:polar amino acid transport system substrate-binding protein